MHPSLIAIDVAILVAGEVAAAAVAMNRVLSAGRPDALHLDETHLPHVTIAQQFVERARLDELFAELDRLLRHEPALPLRVAAAAVDHGTVWLAVESTPDLQRVHESVMDAIAPFESPEGDAAAFHSGGEEIRPRDVEWVRNFRENAGYAHYRPHVSVGHGAAAPAAMPLDFRADRVAVCALGRYCTCRVVLKDWKLG